jgi:cyanate permease
VTTLADPPQSRTRMAWLMAGIGLLAINLRPAVVAVAPLTSGAGSGSSGRSRSPS